MSRINFLIPTLIAILAIDAMWQVFDRNLFTDVPTETYEHELAWSLPSPDTDAPATRLAIRRSGSVQVLTGDGESYFYQHADREDAGSAKIAWTPDGSLLMVEQPEMGSIEAIDVEAGVRYQFSGVFGHIGISDATTVIDNETIARQALDANGDPESVLFWSPRSATWQEIDLYQLEEYVTAVEVTADLESADSGAATLFSRVERNDLVSIDVADQEVTLSKTFVASDDGVSTTIGRVSRPSDRGNGGLIVDVTYGSPFALRLEELSDLGHSPSGPCASFDQLYEIDLATGGSEPVTLPSYRIEDGSVRSDWIVVTHRFDLAGNLEVYLLPKLNAACQDNALWTDEGWTTVRLVRNESGQWYDLTDESSSSAVLMPDGNTVSWSRRGTGHVVSLVADDGAVLYDGEGRQPLIGSQGGIPAALWPRPDGPAVYSGDLVDGPMTVPSPPLPETEAPVCDVSGVSEPALSPGQQIVRRDIDDDGAVELITVDTTLEGPFNVEAIHRLNQEQCNWDLLFGLNPDLYSETVDGFDAGWLWCVGAGNDLLSFGDPIMRFEVRGGGLDLVEVANSGSDYDWRSCEDF